MRERELKRQCTRCILNSDDDPNLTLDEGGVCNYCREYDQIERDHVCTGVEGEKRVAAAVEEIRKTGQGSRYDCILGLSGGVDSTYLAYQAHLLGLKPLAVHFDNGWNSELAVMNIENIVKRLGFDLHTYVVDWEEFRDVQLAYLRASVIDIEVVTDHAILGTMYRLAKENRIRFVLSGNNIVTEAVLPPHWIFNKADHVNLKAIHRAYGKIKLKSFPLFDTRLKKYCHNILGIKSLSFLNWMPYQKADVKETIARELGWRDYGGKHYESVFTRFYQGYILPTKFGVDKRKAHLSNLICSGQLTRAAALEELRQPIYPPQLLKLDKEFVLKKLGLSPSEFEEIMRLPVRSHLAFAVERPLHERYPILLPLRKLANFIKDSRGRP